MSTVNGSLSPNIPVIHTETDPSTAVPGTSVSVQLGGNTHVVAPNTRETQSVGQGGTSFPSTLNQDVTANASMRLGMPTATSQNQPVGSRKVGAAEQAEVPEKSYKFTFRQLDDIAKGTYNVGEVVLGKGGVLMKANNHVHRTKKNTVITSPQENARLRQQVFDCIADQYRLGGGEKEILKGILLDGGRASLSLSRDELGRLLKGVKDGQLGNGIDDLKADLDDIRKFKIGDWVNTRAWQGMQANYQKSKDQIIEVKVDGAPADILQSALRADFMRKMRDGGLIKGLQTDIDNDVVREVSENAKFDFARSLVDNEQVRYNNGGMGFARRLLESLFRATRQPGQYGNQKIDNRLQIYRGDVLNLVHASMPVLNNKVRDGRFISWEERAKSFANELLKKVEDFCETRLARRDPDYANPGKILENNAKPDGRKMYIRQTFNRCDIDGKPGELGSQFCFFNSVVNAVMAGGRPEDQAKLSEMFTKQGFTLRDRDGNPHTYAYDSQALPRGGNYSLYEETLNEHFKLIKDERYYYSAGDASDAAIALGMNGVEWSGQSEYAYPGEGENRSEEVRQRACVNDLNKFINDGKFVTYCEDGHYVAVKGLELADDGSVKLSIVDDRADRNGRYEYEKTYAKDHFKVLCMTLAFSVLEWKN